MSTEWKYDSIKVSSLVLDLSNPRHGKLDTPDQAMTFLIEEEQAVELALNIAKLGSTNPMDLLGVIEKSGTKPVSYISLEGNRRVCALKILHDPERIPVGVKERTKRIKQLKKAAEKYPLPDRIQVVVFNSQNAAQPFIDMLHIKEKTVAGRRGWTSDQQGRRIGGGRYSDALQLLDLAESIGLIGQEERKERLTTVHRYVGNSTVRSALGLTRDVESKTLSVEVGAEAFAETLRLLIKDTLGGRLSSRANAVAIKAYAAELLAKATLDRSPSALTPLSAMQAKLVPASPNEGDSGATSTPPMAADTQSGQTISPVPKRTRIGSNLAVEKELYPLQNQKLNALYSSFTRLPLKDHAPLLTVGLWSFLTSLACLHKNGDAAMGEEFLGNRMEQVFGIKEANERKAIRAALTRIDNQGNSTKHHAIAANFDGQQLANDFDVVAPLIAAVCANIPK